MRPGVWIHHSDRGSQYTSFAFTRRLVEAGVDASVGSVGDGYDNALAESTIGLYKAEPVKGVGMFASMRVSDVDAEQVSNLFGTYEALELTQQTGQVGVHPILTGTGSVRTVMRFVAHPNDIKALPDASAVVKLDRPAGRGRTISVVRFWPAASDWPVAPSVPAAQRLETGSTVEAEEQLPWLPEPPSAVAG